MNSFNKILCINPPTGIYNRDDRCQDRSDDIVTVVNRPPMNLLYEAAIIKKLGKEVLVKDYSAYEGNWDILRDDIITFEPDMVVFNVTTPSFKEDIKTCDVVKSISPKTTVLGRGAHFNLLHKEVMNEYANLDLVIRGDWEETLQEIVSDKPLVDILGITYRNEKRIIVNPERPILRDLDSVPFPDRSWFDHRLSFRPDTHEPEATIRVSRGCPCSCIYCLAPVVAGHELRMRSPKSIVDEIEQCKEEYNIKSFLFRSDLFTVNRKWLKEICHEILMRNIDIHWACNTRVDTIDQEKITMMKKAGCWALAMGVESGNEESLKRMNKKITLKQAEKAVQLCRELDVKAFTYFLIGFPWETRKHIEDTINFAIHLNGDLAQFSPLYPYPGTMLYQEAKSLGLLEDANLHPYALVKPVMGTLYLSKEEIEKYLGVAWKRFHLRPSYIFKTLWDARSPRKIMNYIQFGCKALVKLQKNVK